MTKNINWGEIKDSHVILGDNLPILQDMPDEFFQLIYIDPPFNTGKVQSRQEIKAVKSKSGERIGFKGQSYETIKGKITSYNDDFKDYWAFLEPRLVEAYRLLKPTGSFYLHLDYREVHYAKVLLDYLFGRENFLNEIIWAYDYGARATKKWPAKHDNILVYVKNTEKYFFDNETVDREPYMAPGLVTPEKAARGKLPTDVWWHTIVSPTGKEKTGYATQKPEGILRRIIQASSRKDDWVLDFFAGSGTTAAVAKKLERKFVTIDENPESIAIIKKRLGDGDLIQKVHYIE
jgi:site-specific DNA-methyltransferase (adenine-specific)